MLVSSSCDGSKNRPVMTLLWLPIHWSTMKKKDNIFEMESGPDFHNSSGQRWQKTSLVEKKKTLAHRPPRISDPKAVQNHLWIQKRGRVRSGNRKECKANIGLPGMCDGPEEKEKIGWDICYQIWFGFYLRSPKGWPVSNLVLLLLLWRQPGGAVISTVASQRDVQCSKLGSSLSVWRLHVLPVHACKFPQALLFF